MTKKSPSKLARKSSSHRIATWIHGASGRMGQELQLAIGQSQDFRVVGGSSRTIEGDAMLVGERTTAQSLGHALRGVALVIDFTGDEGNKVLLDGLKKGQFTSVSVLIGSTGLGAKRLGEWRTWAKSSKSRVLFAPNTSAGVHLALTAALRIALPATKRGFDIEIVETHHRNKKDAPSGTALYMAQHIGAATSLTPNAKRSGARSAKEIGIQSVRGGGVIGEHVVRLISGNEEIFIGHRALHRSLFADGALHLAQWLTKKSTGYYELNDVDF